jgi:hypothetical protein
MCTQRWCLFLRHSVYLYSTVVTPYTLYTVEVGRSIKKKIVTECSLWAAHLVDPVPSDVQICVAYYYNCMS